MEYRIHPLLDEGRIREPKSRSVLRACKFARQPEESGAQFAQGQALPFFRETCPLKSCDQVVGQPNYFQIEGVGRESTSGNLPERIVLTIMPISALVGACRVPDYAEIFFRYIDWRGSRRGLIRHNQRPSRKANSLSSGRYRVGVTPNGSVCESAFSFKRISACRYTFVVSGDSCPSQSAITERSTPL